MKIQNPFKSISDLTINYLNLNKQFARLESKADKNKNELNSRIDKNQNTLNSELEKIKKQFTKPEKKEEESILNGSSRFPMNFYLGWDFGQIKVEKTLYEKVDELQTQMSLVLEHLKLEYGKTEKVEAKSILKTKKVKKGKK